MFGENLVVPMSFFTLVGNPLSEEIIWAIAEKKIGTEVRQKCQILSTVVKGEDLYTISCVGVCLFDSKLASKGRILRYLWIGKNEDEIPKMLGCRSIWAVEIHPRASGSVDLVSSSLIKVFSKEHIERMLKKNRLPWGTSLFPLKAKSMAQQFGMWRRFAMGQTSY